MTTTAIQTTPRFHSETGLAEEGPIVLAAKPLDGTRAPLAVARWLALREDRPLHVISVLETNDSLAIAAGSPPMPRRYYDEERASIATRMQGELKDALSDDVTFRVDVLDGPSARSVVDVAHDRGARLIVIGTGKHDSLGRFIYGERAMQIVRIADRPVLIVPRGATAGFIRHALVAVDFSPASLRAAAAALPMLSRGSLLTLVHVKPRLDPQDPHAAAHKTTNNGRCAELFARFIKLMHIPPGVEIETKVLWGEPVAVIDDFARRTDVSLIASGRRQNYTLAERMFVGSVSAGLMRRVNCPILIAPEQDDASAEERSAPLTGVASWTRDAWHDQLEKFCTRHRDQRVRLSVEVEAVRGGRCVTQDYLLRAITFDTADDRLGIMLGDRAPTQNILSFRFSDVTELTLFTDIAGNDTHLRFENASGRGTLTIDATELP